MIRVVNVVGELLAVALVHGAYAASAISRRAHRVGSLADGRSVAAS
jgi:hypothetical protein